MELVLQGWLGYDEVYNLGISQKKPEESDSWQYSSLAEEIMNYFNYMYDDGGLGRKITTIENANLRCWFSDNVCTLEEAHGVVIGYFRSKDFRSQADRDTRKSKSVNHEQRLVT